MEFVLKSHGSFSSRYCKINSMDYNKKTSNSYASLGNSMLYHFDLNNNINCSMKKNKYMYCYQYSSMRGPTFRPFFIHIKKILG